MADRAEEQRQELPRKKKTKTQQKAEISSVEQSGAADAERKTGEDEGEESDRDGQNAGQRHGKVAFFCFPPAAFNMTP